MIATYHKHKYAGQKHLFPNYDFKDENIVIKCLRVHVNWLMIRKNRKCFYTAMKYIYLIFCVRKLKFLFN